MINPVDAATAKWIDEILSKYKEIHFLPTQPPALKNKLFEPNFVIQGWVVLSNAKWQFIRHIAPEYLAAQRNKIDLIDHVVHGIAHELADKIMEKSE